MNVSVVDLSVNQKKLQVEIPAQKVQQELETRYRDLAKRVRIKGFRPGKIPRTILKSYYGKSVENEVSAQFVQETFTQALRQVDLKPLTEADVDDMRFEDNGAFTYSAIVDVSPPFELEGYKGLGIHRPTAQIDEERLNAELERLREQHGQLRTPENERAIKEGDSVVVDFIPWVEGAVFEKGKTNDYMLEVGKKALHPNFDEHLVGHSSGESLTFELDYPEDSTTREIAGKTVRFDVTIKDLKEKILPELNDEFAQEVGEHETLEALKQELRSELQKREEERIAGDVRQQIIDQLLDKVQLELSSKVVEREVDRLIGLLQRQFESQGLKVDTSRFNTPEIRSEYRPQAEKNLRWRLISEHIAKAENLEISQTEMEEIYSEIARMLRMDAATIKENYSESSIVEQSKESKIQEKVLQFLEQEAVEKASAAEEELKDQE